MVSLTVTCALLGGSPFQGVPAAVNSTGDQGQDLPVPPRRQMVSLTC